MLWTWKLQRFQCGPRNNVTFQVDLLCLYAFLFMMDFINFFYCFQCFILHTCWTMIDGINLKHFRFEKCRCMRTYSYTLVNWLHGRILLHPTDSFEKTSATHSLFSSSRNLICNLHKPYRHLGKKSCKYMLNNCETEGHFIHENRKFVVDKPGTHCVSVHHKILHFVA